MGFTIASVVFYDNTVQSAFHGLNCSWQDYFTLQVGKVVAKYQLKESLSFRLKVVRNVPINPINSIIRPTIGFHVEFVRHKGVEMEIWDVTVGGDITRPLLVHYYKGNVMDAIVYLVDSTERELFPQVRQELRDTICATAGQGCQEALDWVANVVKTSVWK